MTSSSAHNRGLTLRELIRRERDNVRFRAWNPARYRAELMFCNLALNLWGDSSSPPRLLRVALVSDGREYTSEEQFNPFWIFRPLLRRKLGLISVQVRLNDVMPAPAKMLLDFNVIVLKLSYRTRRPDALAITEAIRKSNGKACVLYFDGDDDVCVQWPEILTLVDVYVKKHTFAKMDNYLRRFSGKSNLHDYVAKAYGHRFSNNDYGGGDVIISETGPVAKSELSKIVLGYNLALDRRIIDFYNNRTKYLFCTEKSNDIVFRGSMPPPDVWMYHLRNEFQPILERLGSFYRVIVSEKRVARDVYYTEMMSSKICFSPFGYGEICWRDFEAVLCGCLLLKPDVSHIRTNPDLFVPYVTYIPVRWDFSDLEDKCVYYLRNAEERTKITRSAFEVLDEFYKQNQIIQSIGNIFNRCVS